jgi:hypothetical protein
MNFKIIFSTTAKEQYFELEQNPSLAKRFKAVRKTLGLMETNIRHPSLNTHIFDEMLGINGEKVFEAYSENSTPQAYRIFWHYGPDKRDITIIAITPHP